MEKEIYLLILGIIIFGFLFEQFLQYLNKTRWSSQIPDELKNIYDPEKYQKQQLYEKANYNFDIISGSFSFLIMLLMLIFYGFAWVDSISRSIVDHPVWTALIFFGILMFASQLIMIPFSLYGTFVIEEKFGFNKTTVKTWIFDLFKGWILGAVIGGGLMALIIWIYYQTQEMFWIYAWLAISGFMIFMAMFYSSLIVPLFNKQTPLEDGELRTAIEEFSKKAGFKLNNIYKIDGSKRSTKANAYFSGFGPKKRIVLYDTLIQDMEVNELVAVLAHEIGHYKKKHTISSILLSVLQTGITLYILSLFIGNPVFSKALGVDNHSFHIGILSFGILYSPISMVLGLGLNILSRKNEFAADRYAAENYNSRSLSDSLKKLSVKNLSNLTPHPLYVFFNYSHPPLLERLRALSKY
ncbi:MAG: M48 family metallopeptidase [Bacteroidota bacterium]